MSKGRSLFGAAFIGLVTIGLITAQGPRNQGGMGRGPGMGMMGGMVQDPVHQSVLIAFVLPGMQSELGITAQQTTELKQFQKDLLAKGEDFSKQIAARQKELAALTAAGASKNADVKRLLEQIANLRAQQEFAAYETAANMKAAVTEEQRTKLAALKPFELHQAMMSHMTVGDMAQMMQFMGGDGGMMGRGMMGMMGGMMGGGMMGPGGTPGAAPKQ